MDRAPDYERRTYCWKEHVGPNENFHAGYRSQDEGEPSFQRDQVAYLAGLVAPDVREKTEHDVDEEIR